MAKASGTIGGLGQGRAGTGAGAGRGATSAFLAVVFSSALLCSARLSSPTPAAGGVSTAAGGGGGGRESRVTEVRHSWLELGLLGSCWCLLLSSLHFPANLLSPRIGSPAKREAVSSEGEPEPLLACLEGEMGTYLFQKKKKKKDPAARPPESGRIFV